MVEERLESIMRSFVRALESRDVDKALSFFTADASYLTPNGEFKGMAEIRRYLQWMLNTNSALSVQESGIGIASSGDKAAFEHIIRGTARGMRWEVPAVCTYQFSGDKIKRVVTIFDRLSLAKQVATGWMAKKGVNAVIKGAEKGLR
jgi:ketosteroid isomerase-like protein